MLTAEDIEEQNILNDPKEISISPGSETKVTLDITIPLRDKGYNGEIIFKFDKGKSFIPVINDIFIDSVSNLMLILSIFFAILFISAIIIYILRKYTLNHGDDDEKNKLKKPQ